MTWNHRVTKTTDEHGDHFEIREVYYNDAGEVFSMTENAKTPYGETLEELRDEVVRFLRATTHPVIVMDGFEYAKPPWDEEKLQAAIQAAEAEARVDAALAGGEEPSSPVGLDRAFGKWPGDETDEELTEAMKDNK